MNPLQRAVISRLTDRLTTPTRLFSALWIIPFAVAAAQSRPPTMAPIGQYLMANDAQEIALARSGAPDSISDHAEVLVLGTRDYEAAVKGSNGFVCVVVRAWDNNFASPEFWNPKMHAPICFNAAAARSVLPAYLMRTRWALAGATKVEMQKRDSSALASGEIKPPEPGAMSYMMSKGSYLNDDVRGPWHPHVMFFAPRTGAAKWGANVAGSPVMADADADDATTIFFVVVPAWSDGTPDAVHQ